MSHIDYRSDQIQTLARTIIRKLLWTVFVLVLALVFIFPVSMIVIGAFRDGLPTMGEPFSLAGMIEAYTSQGALKMLRNSLILVVVCGTITTAIGAFFAWVNANTNVPLRRFLTPVMVVMLFVPPLFYSFGWIMLANPQNGLLNQFVGAIIPGAWPFNINSWAGLIMTLSLGFVPFTYMLMMGAFRNRDQVLDEAAAISGSGTLRTFFSVTLPSVGPAITGAAILVMVLIFQAFDSPQLIGRPADIYVFSTQIYRYVNDFTPGKYSSAFSIALLMVVLVVVLFLAQKLLLRGRTFTTLTGKSSLRDPQQLGWIRWLFSALIVLFIIMNLILPLGAVLLGSLQPIFGVMSGLSFDNYVKVLTDPMLSSSLSLTAQMAIIGGVLSMSIALVTSYVVLRKRGFLKAYTSFAVWVPWALPGLVTGLAYLWAILTIPGFNRLYGTFALMTAVLVIATIPLCSRLAEGALAQIAPELEEAGRISGASPIRTLFTVVLRLLLPSFIAGSFLSALFISGNLAIPMILAPPGVVPVSFKAYQLYTIGDAATGAALFMVILGAAVAVLILYAIVNLIVRRVSQVKTP